MDGLALIEAFGDFKEDKNISKIDLMAIIEDSLKTLLRKRYDSDDHFDVIVNPDKGDFQIFLNKTIVEDEMSEDDDLEIEISEAKKIDATFEVGEEYTVEIPIEQLGTDTFHHSEESRFGGIGNIRENRVFQIVVDRF